jgi:hypothetical protein
MSRSALGGAAVLLAAMSLVAGCAPSKPPAKAPVSSLPNPIVEKAAAESAACKAVSEAIVTGNEAQMTAAMQVFVTNTAVDTVIRGYARNFLDRPKGDDYERGVDAEGILGLCRSKIQ